MKTKKTTAQIIADIQKLDKGDLYQIATPKMKFMVGRCNDGKNWYVGPYINVEWLFYPNATDKTQYNKQQVIAIVKKSLSDYE